MPKIDAQPSPDRRWQLLVERLKKLEDKLAEAHDLIADLRRQMLPRWAGMSPPDPTSDEDIPF